MTTAIALMTGALAGAHAATWGAYKDSVYEGFSACKFARSVAIGAIAGALLWPLVLADAGFFAQLLLLFGCVYVVERAVFELYKTFLRQEDQSKYHIPMQFHVLGRVVHSRLGRGLAGLALSACLGALIVGVRSLERLQPILPPLALAAVLGLIAGLVSAIMGAWKDAPIEGFEMLKFVRSPAIALGCALLLASFTRDLLVLGAASLGYTIATIETYKTFVDRRAPGKFAGKPIRFPEMLVRRRHFVPLFVAIWVAIALTAARALRDEGIGQVLLRSGGP